MRVEVITPTIGASERALHLPGSVQPFQETVLFARASGYARAWRADIGDKVQKDTVLAEIFIAAPPERVFEAISDPSQTAKWWGAKGLYRLSETVADVRPGGKWRSAGVGDDGTPFHVEGEYLEVAPPRLLVYAWRPSWSESLKTVVRWELEPRARWGTLHQTIPTVGLFSGSLTERRGERPAQPVTQPPGVAEQP